MASFTLRPHDRLEFDSLIGGIASQFPGARIEAAHNDTWASYRVDVSCEDPRAAALRDWLNGHHADCPRT
jgi:hypothetical protein